MSTDAKESARDIIAERFFERGHDQGYRAADRFILDLHSRGFDIVARDHLEGNMEELGRQEVTIDTLRIKNASLAADVLVLRTAAERDAAILAAFQAGSVKQTDAILVLRTALQALYDATDAVLDNYHYEHRQGCGGVPGTPPGDSDYCSVCDTTKALTAAGVVLGGGNE